MARIPTMRIVRPGDPDDYLVINQTDFNPKTMTEWKGDTPPPPPPPPSAPTDPAERIEAIAKAIETLDPKDEEHWTGSGKPNVVSLEAILGWDIKAAERDQAWEAHQKAQA